MPMAITQFTHNLYIQEAESGTDIDVVYRNYFKGDLKKKLLLAAGKIEFCNGKLQKFCSCSRDLTLPPPSVEQLNASNRKLKI